MGETQRRSGLLHLRAWREWRGLSQRELAARAHVSYTTISRLETGAERANWATLAKLAHGLGISREILLHEEPNSRRPPDC